MYNVGKIVDPDILHEMKEDCLNNIWTKRASGVRGPEGDEYGKYRTSKTFHANYRFYPEFCEQLEDWIGDGTKVNQIDLLLYEKGDQFKLHKDVIDGDRKHRIWSTTTILYLSEDFSGQGLKLFEIEGNEMHSHIPRQEVGDTVIFDSLIYHEACPVNQGTRIAAVAWLGFE